MTEAELKAILARNPAITYDDQALRQIPAQEPERRTSNTLGQDLSRDSQSQASTFVCFVFRRTRLLDVDAVSGSGKDLLDGLQDAGFISGDSEDQIGFEAIQQKVGKRKDEGTFIFIATGIEAAQLEAGQRNWRDYLLTRLFAGEKT